MPKPNKQKIGQFFSYILNSKIIYFILLLIILAQFILVSIIFLQNCKNNYLIEQTKLQASSIENKINQINKKVDVLQANMMRMSRQFYYQQDQPDDNQ